MKKWVFRLSCEAGLGDCTAETPFDVAQGKLRTRSKDFLINKFSDLCELCASVVNILHRKAGITEKFRIGQP